MRTIFAVFVGSILAVYAMRALDRYFDGHGSAAQAAARLLQRAELDLQCVAEKFEQEMIALRAAPSPVAAPQNPEAPVSSLAQERHQRIAPPAECAAEVASAAQFDAPVQVQPAVSTAIAPSRSSPMADPAAVRAAQAAQRLNRRMGGR